MEYRGMITKRAEGLTQSVCSSDSDTQGNRRLRQYVGRRLAWATA